MSAGGATQAVVTMLLAPYEYPWSPRYLRVFSGLSYNELHEPLRLTMLSGNGALGVLNFSLFFLSIFFFQF